MSYTPPPIHVKMVYFGVGFWLGTDGEGWLQAPGTWVDG